MFLCREKELALLNARYQHKSMEFIVIYGRRRVGKTALINEFVKDKPTVYFSALQASGQSNLEALSKDIYMYKNRMEGITSFPIYSSFDAAFAELTEMAGKEQVVFVIDEFPYLVNADSSVPSRLQHLLDHDWADKKIFLILCGSSMSFMEKEVLSSKSPLFGRRTAQIRLEPLTYLETAKFHPELSPEENALIYGITGGIPHYIRKLEVNGNIKEALLENFFNTSAYLFEEPQNLLRQEVREPAVYNSVIAAIAGGASKINEISTKVHITTASCSNYIKSLAELGIVGTVEPVVDAAKRKKIYRITDPFFRFWYRFVPSNMTLISSGNIGRVFDAVIGRGIPDYMGLIFESICRQYLLLYAENLPVMIGKIGEWWGTDPKKKKEVQLDVVAEGIKTDPDRKGRKFLIGSCKYKNSPVGANELELIHEYTSVFTDSDDVCYYYIFSKGGFTEELQEVEKKGLVRLVTLEDLYN